MSPDAARRLNALLWAERLRSAEPVVCIVLLAAYWVFRQLPPSLGIGLRIGALLLEAAVILLAMALYGLTYRRLGKFSAPLPSSLDEAVEPFVSWPIVPHLDTHDVGVDHLDLDP